MIFKNCYRTHNCGELRMENVGQEVKLAGWVNSIRKLGGITFATIRDNFGITQILVRDESLIENVCKETVISVHGIVLERESKNPKMLTGDIEIEVDKLDILGKCQSVLPFEINNSTSTREDLRLKYRYLDLRNPENHDLILLRSKMLHFVRNKMHDMGFTEIQTPILANSSPEGARDFIVPTVNAPGEFFALPQAPQQFKQLLMVSGFDRYFQIAPCFRNEPARADRTPGEFYQIDMEMSFATQEDVLKTCEEFITSLFEELTPDREFSTSPLLRIPYREAMEKYCSDKPDLRNPLIVHDLTQIFKDTEFNAFKGKTIKAVCANCGEKSRKWYDEIGQTIVAYEGKGCAWLKYVDGEFTGSIAKFLTDENKVDLIKEFNLVGNESIFMIADCEEMAIKLANVLRNELGNKLELIDKNKIAAMGSSAGGHLAALLSTYTDVIDDEFTDKTDSADYMPDAQILCYPVINLYDTQIAHIGSGDNLTGNKVAESGDVDTRRQLTPSLICSKNTPPAFIWHTFDDATVNVKNSLEYAAALKSCGVDTELHIFPNGRHGLGLTNRSNDLENHVAQWSYLLLNWLKYIGW